MGRGEPFRMRDLPHPDAISGDSAVQADGISRALTASRLEFVRYGARRVPAQEHVARGTRAGVRVDLRAPLFACIDLEAPAGGLARGCAVLRHVVSLQALKPLLASADQT